MIGNFLWRSTPNETNNNVEAPSPREEPRGAPERQPGASTPSRAILHDSSNIAPPMTPQQQQDLQMTEFERLQSHCKIKRQTLAQKKALNQQQERRRAERNDKLVAEAVALRKKLNDEEHQEIEAHRQEEIQDEEEAELMEVELASARKSWAIRTGEKIDDASVRSRHTQAAANMGRVNLFGREFQSLAKIMFFIVSVATSHFNFFLLCRIRSGGKRGGSAEEAKNCPGSISCSCCGTF